jgi:hypothetical protein
MALEKDEPFTGSASWELKTRRGPGEPCRYHDYSAIKPIVYAPWRPELIGGDPFRSVAWEETQVRNRVINFMKFS